MRTKQPETYASGSIERFGMDEDEQFFLEIAFNEPGVSEGEVILSVLKQSRRCVQEVIANLARFLY